MRSPVEAPSFLYTAETGPRPAKFLQGVLTNGQSGWGLKIAIRINFVLKKVADYDPYVFCPRFVFRFIYISATTTE